ncbi:MAG: sensor histidine kinase [Limisphaerales bacterium]
MSAPWLASRSARFLLAFSLWTLIGLSFAAQFHVSSATLGRPVSWPRALGYALGDWYVFGLLAVPVFRLAGRVPVEPPQRLRALAVHGVASLAFVLAYMLLRALVAQAQAWLAGEPAGFFAVFEPLLVKTAPYSLLVYGAIVGVRHAATYYRRAQDRELRAAELEKRLAEARLHALQMQLNPHFLFNTLNAVATLMRRDVPAADRVLVRLGDLLRHALDRTDRQEVPLREELAFLDRYLEIEQTRFGPRLQVERDLDPSVLDAPVPNLLLQPLVETAIKHGVEKQAKPGVIRLTARRDDGVLELIVADNGPGLPAGGVPRARIGLANTQERLAQLYGAAGSLGLRGREGGGTEAVVRVPLRGAGIAAAAPCESVSRRP